MKWPGFITGGSALAGVDVGTSSVKLVALEMQNKHTLRVTAAATERLAVAGDDAAVETAGDARAAALRRVLAAAGLQGRAVATTVGPNAVIVKRLSLTLPPTDRADEMDAAVRLEAVQHLPFPVSEVNFDYHLLEVKENGSVEVLLVAVKKDKVDDRVQLFAQGGMNVRVVDHDPLALLNCYEYNYQPDPDRTVALFDVGAAASSLCVVRGSDAQFVHELGVGGQQYTDALQKECALNFEQAEAAKRQKHLDVKTQPVIDGVLRTMRLEIRKTMDFYQAAGQLPSLSAIFVAGGSASLPGLEAMLHDEFQIEVKTLDPFRRAHCDGRVADESRPQYAVAMGLALRAFDRSTL